MKKTTDEIEAPEEGECGCAGQAWTDLRTGIVYCQKAEGCSIIRDVYEHDPEFLKRSALHQEVKSIFKEIAILKEVEVATLKKLQAISICRNQLNELLMDAHWVW